MRHSTTNILQGSLKKGRIDTYANNAFHFKNIVWRSLTLTASNLSYHVHKVAVTQESVKTPGQTIDLELSVIDTHPGDRERTTVVGLHGNPGWAVDFEPLIQQLSERNIRFIAPTFPGMVVFTLTVISLPPPLSLSLSLSLSPSLPLSIYLFIYLSVCLVSPCVIKYYLSEVSLSLSTPSLFL